MEIFGNGAGTGIEITAAVCRIIPGAHHWDLSVCLGVVVGATMPVTAGLLFATSAVLASATSSLASALPAVLNRILSSLSYKKRNFSMEWRKGRSGSGERSVP